MRRPDSWPQQPSGLGVKAPDDLEQLYGAFADRLRQIVRFSIRAPEALIDDACQIAWSRLLRSWDCVRSEAALSWLVTTATREAVHLTRHSARELSLDELCSRHREWAPLPQSPQEIVELRARLAEIRCLPERQQRLVWLQGLGFSYTEMAGQTGDSRRTVERQLMRAKRALRSA
jgi:RNA polymerase sigma factor (sigma-70 family)